MQDWRRALVWLLGAVAVVLSYGAALAASPLNIPDSLAYDLLLGVSGFAATMVGGAGAILLYDRARRRPGR